MRPGEVHASVAQDRDTIGDTENLVQTLLGENGAGKSTLIKVLAGVHRADAGEVRMRNHVVDPVVDTLPITFIYQDLGLVDSMSVAAA